MLVRLKDRPAPIQPESEALDVPFIIEKKTVVYDDAVEDYKARGYVFAEDQPPGEGGGTQYFPGYTQKKRVERTIVSSEVKHRVDSAPCIDDRLKMMKKYEEEKEKLLKKEAVLERRKKEQEEKMAALKAAMETGDTSVMDKEEEDEEDLLLAGTDGIELDEEDIAELKRLQLDIKEKKFTAKRNSVLCHLPVSSFKRKWRAFWLASGWSYKNNPFDEVLPWMFLGRGDLAQNSQFLEKMGFTHILNLTTTIKNAHASKFVYKRIPIEDKITENAAPHFRTIIDFIRRVAACKGKIYIHCTVGASRAPMAVMLYFVVVRKIALVDIYNLLQAIRPVVGPNKHFLFELSEIEVHQGMGSSVLHHKDWMMHYEYNEMRADDLEWRKPQGLYKTAKRILSPENTMLDGIDDLEAAIERKRALFAAKAEKKKRKLRESHGGK